MSVEFSSTAAFAYRFSVTAGGQVRLRHSPFKRGMREFESHPADQISMRRSSTVERGSHKPVAAGSNPAVATNFFFGECGKDYILRKDGVAGSNPAAVH